jgi:hypothetical protein
MAERYEDKWDRSRDWRGDRDPFRSREQPRYFGTRTGSYSEGGAGFGGGYGDRYDESGPYRGALGYRDWPTSGATRDRWFSGGYDDGRVSTYRPGPERPYARGPKGYERSDERIREDVSDRLMYRYDIDSSEVSVTVAAGTVTLDGTVPERRMKHAIEDLAVHCAGVKDVDNRIRVQRPAP